MLSRAVSIYVLSRRRADLLALQNVSQTHLQELLNLDPGLQDDLIARVENENGRFSACGLPSSKACHPSPNAPAVHARLRFRSSFAI